MKLSYTIIYVQNVQATVDFYEKAFGLTRRFVHESGQYAEMVTGETTLAFASHEIGASNLPADYSTRQTSEHITPIEIAFITEDVRTAYERAVSAGAKSVSPPITKPWGQTVGYVQDKNGTLVEIASPMGKTKTSLADHVMTKSNE